MNSNTVFDRLVSSLSSEERQALLEKIKRASTISQDPLLEIDKETREQVNFESEYRQLGFWQKFFIFVQMLFLGKKRDDIIQSMLFKQIIKDIQTRNPFIIDFKKNVFLPTFYEEIRELRDAMKCFARPTSEVLGNAQQDFIVFLSGFIMPSLQDQLLLETDPEHHISVIHSLENSEQKNYSTLKKVMEESLEETLGSIPESQRQEMYHNIQFLHSLNRIGNFPFEKILSNFIQITQSEPVPCEFIKIHDQLKELNSITESMQIPPSSDLLSALFLFFNRETIEDKQKGQEETENDITRQLQKAESALVKLRTFHQSVPLFDIVRYVVGDINYKPPKLGGGEDWFVVFRQFWENKILDNFAYFTNKRKQAQLVESIHNLAETEGLSPVKYYEQYFKSGHIKGRYALTLSFIKTLFQYVVPEKMNYYLKILLINGDFYKEDNRQQFTDAFNTLLHASEQIERIEQQLGPDGELGKTMVKADQEIVSLGVKRKKISSAMEKADEQAETVIKNVASSFQLLGDVLYGVLYGEVGGKYDTLSNLNSIGGKSNERFKKTLDMIMDKAKSISRLLFTLLDLEREL